MDLHEFIRFFVSLVFLLPSVVFFWSIYRRIQCYVCKLPPGPALGFPLLGYIPFVTKEPHKKFNELSKRYGPLLSLRMGMFETIVVSDYENAKELLSHPSCLGRPSAFFSFLPYEAGFAGMNGEEWKEQRRFCIHTMRNLGIGKGTWEKIIQDDVTEFLQYLEKEKGQRVDVSVPMLRSGICSIASLLVGRRFPKKETNLDVKVIAEAHHIITEYGKLSNPLVLMPWMLKYLVKFNIAGYAHKMEVLENFTSILRREIEKHQGSEDNFDSSDFIGHYLDVLNKKDTSHVNKYFSVGNLIGHMIALFIGGSDTTVASVSWLLMLMAEHLKIQEKVQKEIKEVFGRDGQINWDDRKKLPYTMATILEMERWASIVPFFPPRRVTETFEFRGYTIPKEALIIANGWAMHRDPKYWVNPEEFRPERFLQSAETSGKDPSKFDGYGTFSFGKRNCPGETVATMTIFLYFTGLMQKFAVRMPPGGRLNHNSQHYSAIMHPSNQELIFMQR